MRLRLVMRLVDDARTACAAPMTGVVRDASCRVIVVPVPRAAARMARAARRQSR